MTWTKLPSEALDDPALLALPRGVRLMHVEALVWCNRHGTDGDVPTYALPRVTDEADPLTGAKQLVAAGKWEELGDGWRITEFLRDQPSAADVERVRALSAVRQRRQRQHRQGDHSLCEVRYCEQKRSTSRVTTPVTNGVSHDTRTDPTRAVKAKGRGDGAQADERPPPPPKCDTCHGTGHTANPDPHSNGEAIRCPDCHGTKTRSTT